MKGSFIMIIHYVLAWKLEVLKEDLKFWNKQVFGSASFRKAEALNQIGLWGSRERESILSVEEIEAKRLVVE